MMFLFTKGNSIKIETWQYKLIYAIDHVRNGDYVLNCMYYDTDLMHALRYRFNACTHK